MQYKNLILIGSSHVAAESVKQVKEAIETHKPSIIAIELDKDRLEALLHKGKRRLLMRGVGIKGMLFGVVIGWIEKKVGKIVKVDPGSEMKMAFELARTHNIKLALIDQHVSITLRNLSKEITWKEKWNFVVDILFGMFNPNRHLKELKMKTIDLTKVPEKETIKKVLNYTKKRYPNFYKVIVHDRNVVMANNLSNIIKQYPDEKIVAVVGAGHEEELIRMIKEKLNS